MIKKYNLEIKEILDEKILSKYLYLMLINVFF